MNPKFKKGTLFLPLLLILSFAGFFLVKTIASKTFTSAQKKVEAGIQERYDPNSSRYSLSRHMGKPDTWKPYFSQDYNYTFKFPSPWRESNKTLPGSKEFFEVALANTVVLSVSVQDKFTELTEAERLKTQNTKFIFFQQDPTALGAFTKENNLYFIVRLSENNYFGSQQDFKATFADILKTFEFLD